METERESYHGGMNTYKNDVCKPIFSHVEEDELDDMMECDQHDSGEGYQRQAQAVYQSPDGFNNGFIYHRPLLIHNHCIEEGHFMGITLSLIILFNLALAHHLKAISIGTCENKCDEISSHSNEYKTQVLQQALQLYELSYQLHVDYLRHPKAPDGTIPGDHSRNIGSLRFTMIISNNLGEIHRVAGNSKKHKMCLHHLLSAIMYMVDCNLIVLDSTEMDGFYHNVSPIMLTGVCAQAA